MKERLNKALVKIFPFRLSRREISVLEDDQQAYLGLLCYAASELNALQRMYICLAHSIEEEDWLAGAILIQRNTILRVWSAKLFEILESVKGLAKNESLDATVVALAKEAESRGKELRQHHGYVLARNFRHEATSHYSFKAAKKNLSHLPDHADCNMYLHEIDGNSWYPLGEELMFIGRLNRHGANLVTKEEVSDGLNRWMEWNFEANKWLRDTHVEAFRKIVGGAIPVRFAQETWKWVSPSLVGELGSPTTPLFFRKRPQ